MSWWKKIKPSIKFIMIGIVLGAGGYFTVYTTLHETSTDTFCMTCHSDHSLQREVMDSPHGNNRAGITVHCQDCHIAQEPLHYLSKKIISSKDVIGRLTIDGFKSQEWLDNNRQHQSELALEYISSIDSSVCLNCHTNIYENQPKSVSKLAKRVHDFNYKNEAGKTHTCVFCHRGIAHPYKKPWYSSKAS